MAASKEVRWCEGSTCTKRIKAGERLVGNRYVAGGTGIVVLIQDCTCLTLSCPSSLTNCTCLLIKFYISQQSHTLLYSHHNTILVAPSLPPFHPTLAPRAAMLGLRGSGCRITFASAPTPKSLKSFGMYDSETPKRSRLLQGLLSRNSV